MIRPIFEREITVTARRDSFYAMRAAYAFALLGVLGAVGLGLHGAPSIVAGGTSVSMTQFARAAFQGLLLVQGIAAILLTPALVAGAVSGEVQRKTLGDLLTTELGSSGIVIGKLLARLVHVAVLIGAGVPMVVLFGLLGSVDPRLVLLSVLATVSTAFLLGAVAMLGSVVTRSVRAAMNFVFTLTLLWLILPGSVDAMLPRLGTTAAWLHERLAPINAWIAPTSPFALWIELVRGVLRDPAVLMNRLLWMAGLQLVYGVMLTAVAVLALRPAFTMSWGRSRARRVRAASARRVRRRGRRRPCGDDAMIWKELFVARTPQFYQILGLSVGLLLAALLAWGAAAFAIPAFREVVADGYGPAASNSARAGFHVFLRFVATGVSTVVVLGAASDAAASMTAERERDTWISLVTTPLTGAEIVRAKLLGSLWGARHMAALFVVLVGAGMLTGALHPLGFTLVTAQVAAFTAFAAALGIWVSLRCEESIKSLARTAVGLLLANGLPLLLLFPFLGFRPFAVASCMPLMTDAALASYAEVLGSASPTTWNVMRFDPSAQFWLTNGREMIIAGVLSALYYAMWGWFFVRLACQRFDAVLDRPSLAESPCVNPGHPATTCCASVSSCAY